MEDAVLFEIFSDYKEKFHGNSCEIETNYKKLSTLIVKFNILDLHHLMGINKITNYRAMETVELLENNDFKLSKYKNHPDFDDIVPRINNYNFVSDIFNNKAVDICILDKDLPINTMKLSIVFYKKEINKYVVLGLKNAYSNIFIPATLHENNSTEYSSFRQTKIKNIKWN